MLKNYMCQVNSQNKTGLQTQYYTFKNVRKKNYGIKHKKGYNLGYYAKHKEQ